MRESRVGCAERIPTFVRRHHAVGLSPEAVTERTGAPLWVKWPSRLSSSTRMDSSTRRLPPTTDVSVWYRVLAEWDISVKQEK
jgi:hypothetical protein